MTHGLFTEEFPYITKGLPIAILDYQGLFLEILREDADHTTYQSWIQVALFENLFPLHASWVYHQFPNHMAITWLESSFYPMNFHSNCHKRIRSLNPILEFH